MLFRFHRGGLSESMATVIEVQSLSDLKKILDEEDSKYGSGEQIKCLTCESYGFDNRINWDTHIITAHYDNGEYYVRGFSNGMLK